MPADAPVPRTVKLVVCVSLGTAGLLKVWEAANLGQANIGGPPLGNQEWAGWGDICKAEERDSHDLLNTWKGAFALHPGPFANEYTALSGLGSVTALLNGEPSDRLDLVVLLNEHDARHRGSWLLLCAWLGSVPEISSRVTPRFVDVSSPTEEGGVTSLLDEEMIRGNSAQTVALAEQTFLVRVAKELQDASRTQRVFYDAQTGTSLAKFALAQSATVARSARAVSERSSFQGDSNTEGFVRDAVPILANKDRTLYPVTVPSRISHSEIHHRFGRAVTLTYGNLSELSVRQEQAHAESLDGYIRFPRGGEPELSAAGWSLVEAVGTYGGEPFSASADLLERHVSGSKELASRLASLVRHWHHHQLWRNNLASALVLHDESHSQTVDRHVASLAEPLLESGALSPVDVFLLAASAWLHDWGHASGGASGVAPVDPTDVRKLHGLLTQSRLLSPEHQKFHRLTPDEAAWVGVLSAHHQSWSSNSESPVETSDMNRAQRYRLDPAPLVESVKSLSPNLVEKARDDLPLHAQSLVAILRVADAADLGEHRVPHRDALAASNLDEWASFSNALVDQLRTIDSLRPHVPALVDIYQKRFAINTVRKVLEMKSLTTDKPNGYAPVFASNEANIAKLWRTAVARSRKYLKFLIEQEPYFEQHQQVASVHLVPRTGEGEDGLISVVPYVRASARALWGTATVHPALSAVQKDVARDQENSDSVVSLARLGVRIETELMNYVLLSSSNP